MPSQIALSQALPAQFREVGSARRVRSRLLLVLLAGIVPLLAYVIVSAEVTRHARLDWLQAELHDAARQAAAQEAQTLAQVATLLHVLADTKPPPGGPAMLCAAAQAVLGRGAGDVTGVAVHGADARPACSTGVEGAAVEVGAAHVRAAMAAWPATVLAGDARAGLVMARAVTGSGGGSPFAVLALVLAPSHLPELTLPLRREHVTRMLIDPDDGTLLAMQLAGGMQGGDHVDAPRLLAAMRANAAGGVVLLRDAAGGQRLYGYAELAGDGTAALPDDTAGTLPMLEVPAHYLAGRIAGRAALVIGVPYDALLAQADASRHERWMIALVVAAIGVLASWLLADRVVVRPTLALLARRPGRALSADEALESLRPAAPWLRQHADLAVVAEVSREMVLRLDSGLRILYASPATHSLLGYRPTELIDADLATEPGWEACRTQMEELRQGIAARAPCRIMARRRDDMEACLDVRITRMADGGYVLACRDAGAEQGLERQLAEAQQRLATLALSDLQTGLANRRRFDAALDDEFRRARRAQEPMALVLVGLDEAAGSGEAAGSVETAGQDDEKLRRVARILEGALRRPGDLAARIDETVFAVMLPCTDRIGVQRVVDRLRQNLADECALVPPGEMVMPSIGACSVLPLGKDDNAPALLNMAHAALCTAQAAGGNRVSLHTPRPEPTIRLPKGVAAQEVTAQGDRPQGSGLRGDAPQKAAETTAMRAEAEVARL